MRDLWIRVFLLLLAASTFAACADGAAVSEAVPPSPTSMPAQLAPTDILPTPTLAPGAPTRPIPTPPVTKQAAHEADAATEKVVETATPAPTITPIGTPTPTPALEERLPLGELALTHGDYRQAAEHFAALLDAGTALEPEEEVAAQYQLAVAYVAEQRYQEAVTALDELLSLSVEGVPAEAYYHLAQAQTALGEPDAALAAYEAYLDENPEMAAYVQPLMATIHLEQGDRAAAVAAYEAAVEGPAQRFKAVALRQTLADYYLQDANYDAAIVQYDAIHDIAETENTRGAVTYLAGQAYLLSGNSDAAHERFLLGMNNYPRAYESYLGLVELVTAGVPVDEYQRGVVDYYAAAYAPGIEAFERYLTGSPEEYEPDAHLFLAWSHEALGDLESALAELERYAALEPAAALLETARMQARAGAAAEAIAAYEAFWDEYPEHEEAPAAGWALAELTHGNGTAAEAIAGYEAFATAFPDAPEAPEALYRAGWLADAEGDAEAQAALWRTAAEDYPEAESGNAALVWLLRTLPEDDEAREELETLAVERNVPDYFALRARDIATGTDPFAVASPFVLPEDPDEGRAETEEWLRGLLEEDELPADVSPGALSAALADDERLIVGEKLWRLGRWDEARLEFEALRSDYAESLLSSFQLALYFRDIGLYRSSISAAATALSLAETSIFDAPLFMARLLYPVHYAELILPLAEQYGYDPRLQFALVRQESLFESFARSGAAAQGLSQVIPDTGAWIAERLQWPDYVNEDLYKPHVGLAFGAYYLDQQLQAFDGHVHAALAAYNAGPGNAARWYEEAGSDIDLYVNVVDFAETRSYIKRIYTGYDIYSRLYAP